MSHIMLVEDLTHDSAKLVIESSQDSSKTMWLTGICMQSSIKNRNGRNYPLVEIANAVKSARQMIKENNGIFGELDHPQSLQINSDRISHVITEMWMSGNDAYGKAKLLNTPMGLIAQELVRSGVKIGVSSRGSGAINESGYVNDFSFRTYDIVVHPSAPLAHPTAVYESLDSTIGKKVLTLAECLKEDASAQKYFKKEIMRFISATLNK